MRLACNQQAAALNERIKIAFGWSAGETISWVSPIAADQFAEYFDEEFLERLGIAALKVPLKEFWPRSGPRWDGLAKTSSGKLILVEAKAYIEEAVDYRTKAGAVSSKRIAAALSEAKKAFGATADACWDMPFYQYANRLAHLYFARELNSLDAYLLFLYFADAPDVPVPATEEQWRGALRVIEKSLGLGAHRFRPHVKSLIWRVPEMLTGERTS